jgi:bifunctional non-homologous end joining protein LigD
MAEGTLQEYRRKRDPERTPEPFGAPIRTGDGGPGGVFVVQQHAARQMHWDLRLAIDGVLVSWAVPKGPSLDPKERRLAVRTEDHPLEYADFEGIIPAGNYGAGAMISWDRGTYRTVDAAPAAAALAGGKLDVELRGHKLRGRWALVRTKGEGGKNWLLIRKGSAPPPGPEIVIAQPASVLSGLTVDELRQGVRRTEELAARARAAGAVAATLEAARLTPMHAETAAGPFDDPAWVFELKYDGVRVLAGRSPSGQVCLSYRTGRDATAAFPEIARAVRHLPCDEFVIDGEVVALDAQGVSRFELLQGRLGLTDPVSIARAEIETPVVMFCFDLLSVSGYDVRSLPLSARKDLLAALVPRTGVLRFSEHFGIQGTVLFEEVERLGLEGIVAKRAASTYQCGRRSREWLKIKALHTADLVIVGFLRGQGARAQLGALMLAWFKDGTLTYAGNVGTGFAAEAIADLLARLQPLQRAAPAFAGEAAGPKRARVFLEPRLVAEVRYSEVTEAGVLRQPVFLRLREDKGIEECRAPAPAAPRGATDGPPGTVPQLGVAASAAAPPAPAPPRLRLGNLEKIFWPEDGYTKGDLLHYYAQVWPYMAPYLRDRPVVLTRYPDGIDGKSFFQKNAPDFTPEWVHTCRIEDTDYFICNDRETLLYVINSGCIPVHVWSARLHSLERPDWAILDLDPKGAPFAHVVTLAQHIHRLLTRLAVPHWAKTSGQDGLHVLIPLAAALTHAEARAFAEVVARVVATQRADIATVARPLSDRGGKVYVDFLQNGFGKTIVAPFSVRPRRGAPVSTPLAWREVTARLDPAAFTLRTILRRLRRTKDPMLPVLGAAADVHAALDALLLRMQADATG